MRLALAVAVAVAACNAPAPPPALPWVNGFAATGVGETETQAAARQLDDIVGAVEGGYGAIAVPASFGTVLASYQQGVAIVDANGHLVSRAPGFVAEGSADDLVALAVGDVQIGEPVILLAVTRGGHREATTSLVIYQLGSRDQLDELFEAPIETRAGDATGIGTIAFVPNGLFYRSPAGALERWTYDPARRKYVRGR